MKKKVLSLLLVAAMGISMLVGCGGTTGQQGNSQNPGKDSENTGSEIGGSEDVNGGEFQVNQEAIDNLIKASEGQTIKLTLWCSELEAYQNVMKEVVEDFKKAYPTVTFEIEIGAQSEGTVKDTIIQDPETAADVFVFAGDQIGDLVNAGALQQINTTYTYDPATANGAGSVGASSVDGKMYAYPLTASNGYFLFYDTRYITAEDAKSWEGLIAAAEKQGKQVGMDISNGWYVYGFYAGAGLDATLNADGKTNSCNWNNATGLAVTNALIKLFSSDAFIDIDDAGAKGMVVNADNKLVAYVDGTWASAEFQQGYADGYAATKLPTFNVDGKDIQMGSYAGYKLVGVSAYSENTGWSMLLAEFITSEASQGKIGAAVGEAPANTTAAAAEVFQSNPALVALSLQSEFADLQIIGGAFWTPAETLGKIIAEGTDDVQKALDDTVAGITAPVE